MTPRRKCVRGSLLPVLPVNGDPVQVKNLAGVGCEYYDGRIDEGARLFRLNDEGELDENGYVPFELGDLSVQYRVVFRCRTARVRLEPAWDMDWTRRVIYREVVPQAIEGDTVYRKPGDLFDWEIELVIFGVDARKFGAINFDRWWYVATRNKLTGERKRLWCRWCYSGHGFVQTADAKLIKRLCRELPR